MKRSDFLAVCQKCAMWRDSVGGLLRNLPKSYIIKYRGGLYYPISYTISFDKSGNARHSVMLHDLGSNSVVTAKMADVEAAEM